MAAIKRIAYWSKEKKRVLREWSWKKKSLDCYSDLIMEFIAKSTQITEINLIREVCILQFNMSIAPHMRFQVITYIHFYGHIWTRRRQQQQQQMH